MLINSNDILVEQILVTLNSFKFWVLHYAMHLSISLLVEANVTPLALDLALNQDYLIFGCTLNT